MLPEPPEFTTSAARHRRVSVASASVSAASATRRGAGSHRRSRSRPGASWLQLRQHPQQALLATVVALGLFLGTIATQQQPADVAAVSAAQHQAARAAAAAANGGNDVPLATSGRAANPTRHGDATTGAQAQPAPGQPTPAQAPPVVPTPTTPGQADPGQATQGQPGPGKPGQGQAGPGQAPSGGAVPGQTPPQPTPNQSAPSSPGDSDGPGPSAGDTPKPGADQVTPGRRGTGPAKSVRRTTDQTVALTFDDGPDPVQTPKLLDLLKKYQVKATFCLVGVRAQAHPELVRRIVAEGHALCNHSWDHSLTLGKQQTDDIRADLKATDRAIRAAVPDAKIAYFRAPGGNFTDRLVSVADEFGMTSLYWEVDPRDWDHPDGETDKAHVARVVAHLREHVRAGSIVLSHDFNQPGTVKAYETLLPKLTADFKLGLP